MDIRAARAFLASYLYDMYVCMCVHAFCAYRVLFSDRWGMWKLNRDSAPPRTPKRKTAWKMSWLLVYNRI